MSSELKPYARYKDSGVEWLGEVPEHWGLIRIGWLYRRRTVRDCADEELLSVYRDYGVIPKESRSDNFNKPSEDLSAYQLVEPGDLVMNKMKTWQGSIAISRYRGIVSPAYYVCHPTGHEYQRAVYDSYINYLLRTPLYASVYQNRSKGIRINQWDLEYDEFKRIPVLVPSYREQHAIADYLDEETDRIDTLISEQRELIELLKEKRQALISHCVTRGLDPDVPMKDSGVEWLGEVPEHWRVGRLRYYATMLQDGTHYSPQSSPEGERMYITAKNIKVSGVKTDEVGYIPEDVHRGIYQRCPVAKGDILLIKDGATAGTATVNQLAEEFSLLSSVAVIRFNRHASNRYGCYWLQSAVFDGALLIA